MYQFRVAETQFRGVTRNGYRDGAPTGRQLAALWLGGYEDHVLLRIEDESGDAQVIRLDKANRKALREFLKRAD